MQYVSKEGQNIYDVCLQTYGILDHLFKLLTDNNLSISIPFSKKTFTFDEELISDHLLYNKIINEKTNYITGQALQGLLTDDGLQLLTDDGFAIFID